VRSVTRPLRWELRRSRASVTNDDVPERWWGSPRPDPNPLTINPRLCKKRWNPSYIHASLPAAGVRQILLAEGKSPAYARRSSGMRRSPTVDTCGKWLPKGDKGAVDSLDDASSRSDGDRLVTSGGGRAAPAAQVVEVDDGPARNRTANPLIKSESGDHTGSTSAHQLRKKTGGSGGT